MNKIMTLLEREKHDELLHEEMEVYTDCFTINKPKILELFDADIAKLNVKLEKAKEYHQKTVSKIEKIQAHIKDYFDEQIKKELLLMSGSEDDWQLELRKFPITESVDAPNFESITFEQLQTLDKPPNLQKFNVHHGAITKIELFFDNGLGSASY